MPSAMTPNSGNSSNSLMSTEAIDAALLRTMNETDSAGLRIPPEWRESLHEIHMKQKLQMLSLSPAFEEMLKTGSPKQVREMVDAGMFKVVCRQLGGFPPESVLPGYNPIATSTDRLTSFLQTLPELAAEAWSLGAVRPITDMITKERNLRNPELLREEGLRAALAFLNAMGKPWLDHVRKPSSQKDAKKATGMLKEGIVDVVAEIWCALPAFSAVDKETTRSHYQCLAYDCANVLWIATSVQFEKPQLAAKTELVEPVFHYLLEEPDLFSGVRATSLCLLLNLWLYRASEEELPQVANARKAIAQHKDAWKVLDLLKRSVDDSGREPKLAKPHTIVQASFVHLLGLLTAPPAAAPAAPYLETLCHLLGEIPDATNWIDAREGVSVLFRNGKLTEDLLLTHAYPGFLRAFVAHVARCGYATSSPPGQIAADSRSLELLSPMLACFAGAFRRILADTCRKEFAYDEADLVTAGPSLNPQTLPRLAELMVSTRAAEALAALSGSPFYPRSNELCKAAVESVSKNARVFRALLDQMVPAIVLKMYEDCNAARGRVIERGVLVVHIARALRPVDMPLRFGVLKLPTAQGRCATYRYDGNVAAVSSDVIAGREHVIADVFKEVDGNSLESRLARVAEGTEMKQASAFLNECGVCGLEVVALQRCSRCKAVGYCGKICQGKDWPIHKKVCKQRA